MRVLASGHGGLTFLEEGNAHFSLACEGPVFPLRRGSEAASSDGRGLFIGASPAIMFPYRGSCGPATLGAMVAQLSGIAAMPLPPALPVPASDPGPVALQAAVDYARDSHSAATRRAYRSDWADFSTWCRSAGWRPLPAAPQTIAAYVGSN